jgi:1-acyl-sn-glycerol-3-phosphate acyltransferase
MGSILPARRIRPDTEPGSGKDLASTRRRPNRETGQMSKRAVGSYSRAWRGVSKIILRPLIPMLMKLDWHGGEHFPSDDGMILAVNHLSYADIFAVSLFADKAGRYPVFLAKSTLFDVKGLGHILRELGQLPVYRGQADAALVLKDAELGLKHGACVIFYPEATVTRDPDQWPMMAKTGAARLALSTGAPVIPVAHWGAQQILPYGSFRPHLVPRRTVHILAGPPVDLSAFAGQPLTSQTLRAATTVIMADITRLLGELRGAEPPAEPYHPAIARRTARQELQELAKTQAGSDDGRQEQQAWVTDGPDDSRPAEASPP